MDGSLPDIRLQVAGLLDGIIDLNHFQRWFASAATAIELHGADAEVDFSNRVQNLLAEFTGEHISASELMEALREEYSEYTRNLEFASISEAPAASR